MPGKPLIPPEIKEDVHKLVEEFKRTNYRLFDDVRFKIGYRARFRGKYLYLDRADGHNYSPICRLTWNDSMDNWDFAIYKYSDNNYDPDWFFPGSGMVNGTVTGAMEAGMHAYPD